MFVHSLVPSIREHLPDVAARLEAGVKVADVGCGAAVALITLAQAFPKVLDARATESKE